MRYLSIVFWIVLPLLLVCFLFGVYFIPAWYPFQVTVALAIALTLLLVWVFKVRAYVKSVDKSRRKTATKVILSFWVFICLTLSGFKLITGQDGEWFYGFKIVEKLKLKTEWKSKNSDAAIYIYQYYGHWGGGGIHLWLKKGKMPFMKRIWPVKGNKVDSITENGNTIKIYGYEHRKPMIIIYDTESEKLDIREDTMWPRAIGSSAR